MMGIFDIPATILCAKKNGMLNHELQLGFYGWCLGCLAFHGVYSTHADTARYRHVVRLSYGLYAQLDAIYFPPSLAQIGGSTLCFSDSSPSCLSSALAHSTSENMAGRRRRRRRHWEGDCR